MTPPRSRRTAVLAFAILAFAPLLSFADTLVIDGLPFKNVTVLGLTINAQLDVQLPNSRKGYPLKSIDTIDLDATPKFLLAEQAAAAAKSPEDWSKAADLYAAANRDLPREMKLVGAARTIRAYDGAGKLPEATRLFLNVLTAAPDPDTFDLKPVNLPDAPSKMLTDAANLISGKLKDKPLQNPEVQTKLKSLLLDIYNKAGDPRAAALARELGQGTPDDTAANTTPEQATVSTGDLDQLLAAKKFDPLIKAVDAQLPTADSETAVHLFDLKAQALVGLNKPDEAALTYLRLAIHYPNSSAAPTALLKAADLQKTSDPAAAKNLYQEIMDKYKDSDAALSAKRNL